MKNIFRKYLIIYLAIILICVSFIGGFWFGRRIDYGKKEAKIINLPGVGAKPDYLLDNIDFDLFEEVWQVVKEDYIDRGKILDTEIFYGALRGVVASLEDPHSVFFDPQETYKFSQELKGSFEGIGAEITIKKDQLMVVSPLPGTPAYNAGLMPGDKILAIDDKPTGLMTLYQAVEFIRGEKGTKVKLLISRDSWAESKEIEIIRGEIHFDSVRWNMRDDGLFYVEVTSFNDDTLRLFNQAVREIVSKNPQGIILDLRGNPGGYLDYSIKLASEWIEDGPIVIESYDGKEDTYDAEGKARLKDYSTVVLVNGGSASSSEIVAGALQDYNKATVVGVQTFGKGSVQELKLLSNGSAIKLTVARWLTPNGRQIDEKGIAPDIEIEMTLEDYDNDRDPQLDKAVELLLGN